MDIVLVLILFINAYVIIFFRLNIKHYYEKQNNVVEHNLAAIFSFPPYSSLPTQGKKYVFRYWIAIFLMFSCVSLLVYLRDSNFNMESPKTSIEKPPIK